MSNDGTAMEWVGWVEQLGSRQFDRRQNAEARLCGRGDLTRDALMWGLAHPSDRVRAGSVVLLGTLGDGRHLSAVCAALDDKAVQVRRAALHGLHKLASDPSVADNGVTDAIARVASDDPSMTLRRTAAHALGSRPRNANAEAALARIAATAGDARLQQIARWSLNQQTREASTSEVPTPAPFDPLRSLTTPALVELLGHDLPRVRAEAAGVLFACGADALADLQAGMNHANVRVRRACVDLMDHLADDTCLPPLAEALRDPNPGVRRGALHSLTCQACKPSPLLGDRLAPLIERALTDPDRRVRQVATGALADFADDPRARQALLTLATNDKDAITRKRAEAALR